MANQFDQQKGLTTSRSDMIGETVRRLPVPQHWTGSSSKTREASMRWQGVCARSHFLTVWLPTSCGGELADRLKEVGV